MTSLNVSWNFPNPEAMESTAMLVISENPQGLPTETIQAAALISIAISLKRLADRKDPK